MTTLSRFLKSRWYWLALVLFGIALLSVALYYQYALGDEPCQVCIHARLWVVAFTLIALIMLITPQIRLVRVVGNLGVTNSLTVKVGFFDSDVKMVALTNWYHHFELIKVEVILWDDPQI